MNPILRQIFVFTLLCLVVPLAASAKEDKTEARWRIVTKTDAQDTPHSTVDLVINDRQTVRIIAPTDAGGFQVLQRDGYADYKVPAKALCACFSWWAGSGTRLYAVVNPKGDVEVYRMDEDEGEDSKPRWRRVRTIKVE